MFCCWRVAPPQEESRKQGLTKEEEAVVKIQRALRVDPITLQRIRGPVYTLTRHGVLLLFDAHNLHAYIFRTGDLRDPVARERYTLAELQALQQVSGRPFPQEPTALIHAHPSLARVLANRRRVCVQLLARG